MEQGNITTDNNTRGLDDLITNSNIITENTGYVLTRNNDEEIVVTTERQGIENLNNVLADRRYHLTRSNNVLSPIEDQSVQIATPETGILTYGVRSEAGNFILTRTPALTEYTFFTNNLTNNATFDILGERASRCVHVINTAGKIVKIGVLHTTRLRNSGLIDRPFTFEIIHNDINLPSFVVDPDEVGTRNDGRSMTMDLENRNIFVQSGDCIGLRYVAGENGLTGNYCQVRITIDSNARQNDFQNALIP